MTLGGESGRGEAVIGEILRGEEAMNQKAVRGESGRAAEVEELQKWKSCGCIKRHSDLWESCEYVRRLSDLWD